MSTDTSGRDDLRFVKLTALRDTRHFACELPGPAALTATGEAIAW
jgi:hypothetical protein